MGSLGSGIERDTPASQPIHEFVSGQRAGIGENASDSDHAAGLHRVTQTELRVAGGAPPDEDGAQQRKQPPHVFDGDHVQRAAHQPRPDDGTLLVQRAPEVGHTEAAAPGANPEPGGAQDLRLQAAHLAQHLRRR